MEIKFARHIENNPGAPGYSSPIRFSSGRTHLASTWDPPRKASPAYIHCTLRGAYVSFFFPSISDERRQDNDLDTYRNTLKKQIKDWHTAVTSRRNQDWLILQIIRPDTLRQPTGNFFQIKNSVLDKLRTDFNSDKRDRWVSCNFGLFTSWTVQMCPSELDYRKWQPRCMGGVYQQDEGRFAVCLWFRHWDAAGRGQAIRESASYAWLEFLHILYLKGTVFEHSVNLLLTYSQESLASSFEGMNLFEEALIPYDELEASFYRVSKERNMSWFGPLLPPDPSQDTSPFLSTTKKPYRDLILANKISVLDFRIYLLARQCQLLAKLGRLAEITTKATFFLGAFGERLKDVVRHLMSSVWTCVHWCTRQPTLSPLFVEAWRYSSALSVVEHCNTWAAASNIEASKSASVNAGKGELLDLARSQVTLLYLTLTLILMFLLYS